MSCECDMRTKLVGSGFSDCNPELRDQIAIDNYFDIDAEFRQLQLGENIQEGDVFVSDGEVHRATDIGSGVVTTHHFDHYRLEA